MVEKEEKQPNLEYKKTSEFCFSLGGGRGVRKQLGQISDGNQNEKRQQTITLSLSQLGIRELLVVGLAEASCSVVCGAARYPRL